MLQLDRSTRFSLLDWPAYQPPSRIHKDRITHLKHSISALLQSTFDHLNQKEQLMELAASEYERNSELHSTLHRDHLARVESLFALHERAIQIELDHFQQIEGRQLVELFTKSAKRARDWRSAKLDAMRDQHAAWKMDWDVQGVQQDDEWSAKFQERRESVSRSGSPNIQ